MDACYQKWIQFLSLNGNFIFQDYKWTALQKSNPMNRQIINISHEGGFRGVLYSSLSHILALIVLTVLVSRILHWSLRYLKQPFIVCQLITGILIFSFIPKSKDNYNGSHVTMNPANRRVEHVIGTIGVLYNLFIAGVRVDPAAILQFGKKKPVIIGLASIFTPTVIGFIFYVFKRNQLDLLDADNKKLVFLVLYPLCTTYPITVHEILQELGLLNSELGRLALSSSLLQGSIGWTCVLAHVVIKQGKQNIRHGFIALLCCLAIICFIILIIRPYAMWIGRTTPPYARVREVHILVITTLVLVMGFLSDIVGSTTYIDAPVMMGMAIPDGPPLGTALTERVDLVATEVLLPLIFMPEGFYMEWEEIKQKLSSTLWVGLLVLVTCITKIAACTAGAIFCQMPLKSGLLLGFMMNFRGLSDMLVFLSLTNAKILDKATFTTLVLATITITAICVPLVSIYYKPLSVGKQIGLRAVERVRFHAELSVMACFYDDKPIQYLLEFLESFSFSLEINRSTCIYSLHLVQQQGRAASSLICHRNEEGYISITTQMDSAHNHFVTFEQAKRSAGISVIPFTTIAPLNSMHQDICSLILEKNISLVIMPYPKKNSGADSEADYTVMRSLLPLILEKAQCSVGTMVYHGHNTTRITRHSNRQYQVGVLFFGGPDDREALAVASRMACHPDVRLNVVRFLPSDSTADQNADYDHTYQKVSDDMMISELQAANAGNDRVTVSEIRVRNMELVVSMIKDMEDNNYDLLIVGRRYETNLSEPDDDLVEWTESPELGVIGDLLATDISGIQNVLIVQQHTATEK